MPLPEDKKYFCKKCHKLAFRTEHGYDEETNDEYCAIIQNGRQIMKMNINSGNTISFNCPNGHSVMFGQGISKEKRKEKKERIAELFDSSKVNKWDPEKFAKGQHFDKAGIPLGMDLEMKEKIREFKKKRGIEEG